MFEFNEEVLNLIRHTVATAATHIVPFDINSCKFVPCHIALHTMEFLEKIKEMIEMFDSDTFDSKVVNSETELDGPPFVAPEARRRSSFVVAFSHQAGSKEIVG